MAARTIAVQVNRGIIRKAQSSSRMEGMQNQEGFPYKGISSRKASQGK